MPLGRWATEDEIAAPIVFLLSDGRLDDFGRLAADRWRLYLSVGSPSQKRLAFRSKGSIGIAVRRGAASARDPTAPLALADPGLVLVRGPDRPRLLDERKGWIMSVKLTDAQLVMMTAAAQHEALLE